MVEEVPPMKAVLAEVPEMLLEWRKRTGADIWDEMWEGVLHMPPMPNRDHQDLMADLLVWLRLWWARPGEHRVYQGRNVASIGGWPRDYRIPDLVLLTQEQFPLDRNEYIEGPPLVVIEIRSPGDETDDKLDFYAGIGVPEVWIVDRDSREPEIYRLHGDGYQPAPADGQGRLTSRAGIALRAEEGKRLSIRLVSNPESERSFPDED